MIRNLRPPPKANVGAPSQGYDAGAGRQHPQNQQDNLRLSDWKKEGYPSEFAYAQANGGLEIGHKAKQQAAAAAHAGGDYNDEGPDANDQNHNMSRSEKIRQAQESHVSSPSRISPAELHNRNKRVVEEERQLQLLQHAETKREQERLQKQERLLAEEEAYYNQHGPASARSAAPAAPAALAAPATPEQEEMFISPRMERINEGDVPFNDPLFDLMVKEEMARMEAELRGELEQDTGGDGGHDSNRPVSAAGLALAKRLAQEADSQEMPQHPVASERVLDRVFSAEKEKAYDHYANRDRDDDSHPYAPKGEDKYRDLGMPQLAESDAEGEGASYGNGYENARTEFMQKVADRDRDRQREEERDRAVDLEYMEYQQRQQQQQQHQHQQEQQEQQQQHVPHPPSQVAGMDQVGVREGQQQGRRGAHGGLSQMNSNAQEDEKKRNAQALYKAQLADQMDRKQRDKEAYDNARVFSAENAKRVQEIEQEKAVYAAHGGGGGGYGQQQPPQQQMQYHHQQQQDDHYQQQGVYGKEQQQRNAYPPSGQHKAPSHGQQGVYGLDQNTEVQVKRAKQEAYKRQLDEENAAVAAKNANGGDKRRGGRREGLNPSPIHASDPREHGGRGGYRAEEEDQWGNVMSDDAYKEHARHAQVSAPHPEHNAFPQGPAPAAHAPPQAQRGPRGQSYAQGEDGAAQAKKAQQDAYRQDLEAQMNRKAAAKAEEKARRQAEDAELLEAAAFAQQQAALAKQQPRPVALNQGGVAPGINSFAPSAENAMVYGSNFDSTKGRGGGASSSPVTANGQHGFHGDVNQHYQQQQKQQKDPNYLQYAAAEDAQKPNGAKALHALGGAGAADAMGMGGFIPTKPANFPPPAAVGGSPGGHGTGGDYMGGPSSYSNNAGGDKLAANPTAARIRLIADVYQSEAAAALGGGVVDASGAGQHAASSHWRPGRKVNDARVIAGMEDQKQALQQQIEEVRMRKKKEQDEEREREEKEERRVRSEIARLNAENAGYAPKNAQNALQGPPLFAPPGGAVNSSPLAGNAGRVQNTPPRGAKHPSHAPTSPGYDASRGGGGRDAAPSSGSHPGEQAGQINNNRDANGAFNLEALPSKGVSLAL